MISTRLAPHTEERKPLLYNRRPCAGLPILWRSAFKPVIPYFATPKKRRSALKYGVVLCYTVAKGNTIEGVNAMKKHRILFALAASALLLCACGQAPQSASDSVSAQAVSDSVSAPPASVAQSTPEEQPPEEQPLRSAEIELLERNAAALTGHFVGRLMDTQELPEVSAVTDLQIRDFILTLAFYMEDMDHPYRSYLTQDDTLLYAITRENVQKIAYQLFGREAWSFDATLDSISVAYNEEAQRYESYMEFGVGANAFDVADAQAQYLDDSHTVEVNFTVTSYLGGEEDPAWGKPLSYKALYGVHREDGTLFLRLMSVEKVSA